MAPECFESGSRPTFESDIYSLGMCVVEALRVVEAVKFGKDMFFCPPWGNRGNVEVKVLAKKVFLPTRPTICSSQHWKLVQRMCAFNPTKRIKITTGR